MRVAATLLTVSALAVGSIAVHEGFRSDAYSDGAGTTTIGFGTTQIAGSRVRPGDRIDPLRAVQVLADDADRHARAIAQCIGPVPLHQYEFDAYVSFSYNVGASAFCRSTLVRKLRARPPDYAGACAEMLRWVFAGGRVLPGLERRRQAEYQRCTGPTQEG